MPAEAKPLFRPEAVRPKLLHFFVPPEILQRRAKLLDWTKLLASKQAEKLKETQLLPDFVADVFVGVLGYTVPASGGDEFTLLREEVVKVDGKKPDAVLGRFGEGGRRYIVAVEGKGPLDPLDRPFGSRKKSAVDQGFDYAINLLCDWIVVTNLHEIRLYNKSNDKYTYERFETKAIAENDFAFRRFVYLLGAERVVPADGNCHLNELLKGSEKAGAELTQKFYEKYAGIRRAAFSKLLAANPAVPPAEMLALTQRLLDRVLFCCFCEDRELLERNTIEHAFKHKDPYNPRPIYDNFRGPLPRQGE